MTENQDGGAEVNIPNTLEIQLYVHCVLCLEELPKGVSPREYARLEVGWTPQGFQVWCKRHEVNVLHVDFEGIQHRATTFRQLLPFEVV